MDGVDNMLTAPVIGGINEAGQGGDAPENIDDNTGGQGDGKIESEQRTETDKNVEEQKPDETTPVNAEEDSRWNKIEEYIKHHGEAGLEKLIDGAVDVTRKITEQGQKVRFLNTENSQLRSELDRINSGLQSLPPAAVKTPAPILTEEMQYDPNALMEWQQSITEHATNNALSALARAQAEQQYIRESVHALDGHGDEIGASDILLVESIVKQTGKPFDEAIGEEMKRALRADPNYQKVLREITIKNLTELKADGVAQWMAEQKEQKYKSLAYDKLMRSGDGEALKVKREERLNQLRKNAASGVKGGAGGGGTKYGGGATGKSGSQIDTILNEIAARKR